VNPEAAAGAGGGSRWRQAVRNAVNPGTNRQYPIVVQPAEKEQNEQKVPRYRRQ